MENRAIEKKFPRFGGRTESLQRTLLELKVQEVFSKDLQELGADGTWSTIRG